MKGFTLSLMHEVLTHSFAEESEGMTVNLRKKKKKKNPNIFDKHTVSLHLDVVNISYIMSDVRITIYTLGLP